MDPSAPVFQKCYDFYRILYQNLRQVSKQDRFTWGERCDEQALELLTLATKASFAATTKKDALLGKAIEGIDMLRIYLRLGYDLKILDRKKCLERQKELNEIGVDFGAWRKSL
ncbi:MAG: four helix bundle protein [bacterium]